MKNYPACNSNMRRSRKLFQRWSNCDNLFFAEGRRIQIPLLALFKWRFAGRPMMARLVALGFFRGSGPVLLRNPTFLYFFSGGSGPPAPPPPPPSGSAHEQWVRTFCISNRIWEGMLCSLSARVLWTLL